MNPIWLNAIRASGAAKWWRAGGAPEPIAVYQPIGAASLEASYFRIAGTGGNANLDPAVVGSGVAPTWDVVNGWIGSATAALNSGILPTTDTTVIVRISNGAGFYHDPFGSTGVSSSVFLFSVVNSSGSNTSAFFNSNLSALSVSPAITSGVVAIAGKSVYKDGVSIGTIPAGTATFVNAFGIMATFGTIGFSRNFRGNMQAIAFYPSNTNHAVWVPAVSAAMAELTG